MEPSFQLSIIKYIDRFVSNVSDFIVKDVLNTAHPTYEFTVYFIYQNFQPGHLVLTKWNRLVLLERGVVDPQMAYDLHSRKRLRIGVEVRCATEGWIGVQVLRIVPKIGIVYEAFLIHQVFFGRIQGQNEPNVGKIRISESVMVSPIK